MWVVVMVLGAAGAVAAAPESWLSNVSYNFRSDMAEVLRSVAVVNYSKPDIDVQYVSRIEFDNRAMGMLYNVTPIIIDAIVNKQAYPEGIVSISGQHLEVAPLREHARELAAHYAGPVAAVASATLFGVGLPLAGLVWCCCGVCRGRRRRRSFDRRYDGLLRGVLAILLIALLTLLLSGVVCLFATEQAAAGGLRRAPASLRAAAADARAFLNASDAQLQHLLRDNYRQLHDKLAALLTGAGMTVSAHLGEFSQAVSVSKLNAMVSQLRQVQLDLRRVRELTNTLRQHAEDLSYGLRKVKGMLLDTLARCQQPQCKRLQDKHNIGQLSTEIHYSQMLDKYFPTMPDVAELLGNVTRLLESNLTAEVAAGQQVFLRIKLEMQRSVQDTVPALQLQLDQLGSQVAAVAARAGEAARRAAAAVSRLEERAAAAAARAAPAAPLRRRAALAAAAAVTLVVGVCAAGVACGVCGRRGDAYGGAGCCSKPAAARCLSCGVVVSFVVGGAAALLAAAAFLSGVAAQRFICDPLVEPRGNRLFADVERLVDLEEELFHQHQDPDFNLTYVILRCHANMTIYQVLQLWREYDMEQLQENVTRRLHAAVAALRPQYPRGGAGGAAAGGGGAGGAAGGGGAVRILSDAAKRKLEQLAGSGLSDFDFDKILDALENNMTSLSLSKLSVSLSSTAASLQARAGFQQVAGELLQAAQQLDRLQLQHVRPLLNCSDELNRTATSLRDGLRLNHTSQRRAIEVLLDETSQAETFLQEKGSHFLNEMMQEFGGTVDSLVQQYLSLVKHEVQHSVGRCGPLSAAYNASTAAFCTNVLLPHNGYWVALAWCVMVMVPTLVVASRLSALCRRPELAAAPDNEYLYDAYVDRDNVPLANAYKAEKRAGASGGARRGGGAGEARPDSHPRRYHDMAPKHWEEGPPRYAGPTEYERPPPYYYPGSTDRQ